MLSYTLSLNMGNNVKECTTPLRSGPQTTALVHPKILARRRCGLVNSFITGVIKLPFSQLLYRILFLWYRSASDFLPRERDTMLARYMLLPCVCLFVYPSARPSVPSLYCIVQEAQLSLRDRATRACQLKSGKVLHKCRRLVFEKL